MSIKDTVLEGYCFDARDFSDSQLITLEEAGYLRKGNKELQEKFNAALHHQLYRRRIYFKRLTRARQKTYFESTRTHIKAKSSIIGAIAEWFTKASVKLEAFAKRITPASMLIDNYDLSDWPSYEVDPESANSPHIVASMPEYCVELTGWERLKQAFMPQRYMENYDPNNQSHTFNKNTFLLSTTIASIGAGTAMGYGHAKRDLESYRRNEASVLYDSKYWALRARESVFTKTHIRYCFRWGWRIGFIYAITYGISQSLTIYKMEDKIHHYAIGCSVPFALYSWKLGPVGMLKTGLLTAIFLGIPMGIFCSSLRLNPRPLLYFTKVEPRVNGPFSDASKSYEELFLSNERLLAILDILKSEHSPELNNADFYRKFLRVE